MQGRTVQFLYPAKSVNDLFDLVLMPTLDPFVLGHPDLDSITLEQNKETRGFCGNQSADRRKVKTKLFADASVQEIFG